LQNAIGPSIAKSSFAETTAGCRVRNFKARFNQIDPPTSSPAVPAIPIEVALHDRDGRTSPANDLMQAQPRFTTCGIEALASMHSRSFNLEYSSLKYLKAEIIGSFTARRMALHEDCVPRRWAGRPLFRDQHEAARCRT
jgi:hypothetical protein